MVNAEITNKIQDYFIDKPVKQAYLFGSYATNTQKNDSDIDILVELDYSKPIGLKFLDYKVELEKLLGREVDLVTTNGISKLILNEIENQKFLIYERSN